MYADNMVLPGSPYRSLGLRAQRFVADMITGPEYPLSADTADKDVSTEVIADLEDTRLSRQGDPDSYRRLVERHQEYVAGIMWKFSRDHQVHEELVQDVFVEAYLSLHTYREEAPFAHWLSRIATRVGYHHWKQQSRRRENESFSLQDWDQMALDETEQPGADPASAAEMLHNLLAQLPPRDRLVLTLRYLEGCSVVETAHRTGWTRTMVKVQALRARKKLERLFRNASKEVTS